MAGINITSVNRQVKDISQEIYAAKLQRASGKYFGIEVHVPNEVRKSTTN